MGSYLVQFQEDTWFLIGKAEFAVRFAWRTVVQRLHLELAEFALLGWPIEAAVDVDAVLGGWVAVL